MKTIPLALLAAQTRVSMNTQVTPRPSIVVTQLANCAGGDQNHDCTGMRLVKFKLADGSVDGPYIMVPAPAGFQLDAKWTTVAVTLPQTTTGIPCSQTKP